MDNKDKNNNDNFDYNDFYGEFFEHNYKKERANKYFVLEFVSIISIILGYLLSKIYRDDKEKLIAINDGLVVGISSKTIILVLIIMYFILNK